MTVETAWSDLPGDELIDEDNRRYAPLALILRSRFVVDIDCWGQARGQPIKPGALLDVIRSKLKEPPR
jgi:2-oxoglutarate ferredoxin oxidoreductase subunit alpha